MPRKKNALTKKKSRKKRKENPGGLLMTLGLFLSGATVAWYFLAHKPHLSRLQQMQAQHMAEHAKVVAELDAKQKKGVLTLQEQNRLKQLASHHLQEAKRYQEMYDQQKLV